MRAAKAAPTTPRLTITTPSDDNDNDDDDDDTCEHADDYDVDDDNDDYDNDTVEDANNDDDPLVLSEQNAEFNDDNAGATNVDIEDEEDLSPSCKIFYRQFIQPLGGERIAREIVKPFLPQIFELICKHHRFFDINGKDVALGIVPPKITTMGGVYVTVEKEKNADGLYTIKTVGSTSNFQKRLEYKIKVRKVYYH